MIALRLAPVCFIPNDFSWSPILTAPEGVSFATFNGARLLVAIAPLPGDPIPAHELGRQAELIKQSFSPLLSHAQPLHVWLEKISKNHPNIECSGMHIEHAKAHFFSSNGAGIIVARGDQVGILCRSNKGSIVSSVGELKPQDRFMLASSSLLTILQQSDLSFMSDPSFDQSKRFIENSVKSTATDWFVGALGEAVVSHAGGETLQPALHEKHSLLQKFRQRLRPHYPKLKPPKHHLSRMSLSVGLLLLFLLIVSIVLGSRQRQARQQTEQFNSFMDPLEAQVAQAYEILEVNPLEAKRLVKNSQETFDQNKDTYEAEEKFRDRLETFKNTITQATVEVVGISKATALSPWHDLTLIQNEASGDEIIATNTNLFILDRSRGLIYGIDVNNKEAQVVAGGSELQGGKHLTAQGNRLVVENKKGLIEVSVTQKTTATVVDTVAGASVQATALWSGNIYTLDPATPQIWKYPGLNQGVGNAQEWLKDVSLVGSDAIEMAIDGDVWVLHSDGGLSRIRQGNRAGFSMEVLDLPLSSASHVALGLETDVVFILDDQNHRILELTKSGKLNREYTLDEQLVIKDMTFSDATQQLFILSGQELFVVPR